MMDEMYSAIGFAAQSDSMLGAHMQKLIDFTLVDTACRIANFSLMSSIFLSTGKSDMVLIMS